MIAFRLFTESLRFAWHALTNNKLRTFLSLLGVTIGILAIISVFTVVDSLEDNVRDSVDKLGTDVIYIQKWPWGADESGEYKWWDFWKRPHVKLEELGKLQDVCQKSEAMAFMISANRTLKYESNSIENVEIMASSYEFNLIRTFELEHGRYFTEGEISSGKNYVLIGYEVAMALFNRTEVIGETIKVGGRKVIVIGVFTKEGEDMTGNSLDAGVLLPITFGRNIMNVRRSEPMIMVKAKEGIAKGELKDELRGVMRSIRKLKPRMLDDFALNEISVITNALDSLFSVIGMAGWVIGGFSILVGGFGIANIMFVSVKERTKLIGIQKALGAKNNFILTQFLLESVILCMIGGALGLLLVFALAQGASSMMDFSIQLSMENIILGFSVSIIIGIVSGIVPALSAARLDPVEAIRR
jgi:putative ABC transport system permease protein